MVRSILGGIHSGRDLSFLGGRELNFYDLGAKIL
nr:MAG TPA: hypothetical protein [Caudoviricetes sp.]